METVGKLIARVMREARCEENRRTIHEFLNFLEGEGYSEHYQSGFAKTLLLLDKHLGKPFREAKEAELMAFLVSFIYYSPPTVLLKRMSAKVRESRSKVDEEAMEIARKAIRKYDKLLRSLAYK